MTKRPRVLLFLIGVVLGAMWLSGCDSGPTEPTVIVASPTPSPTPSPSAPDSCEQVNLTLAVLNGAGNPDAVFDYREFLDARATPTNRSGSRLPNTCDFLRVVGWQSRGPGLSQYGDLTGFNTLFKATDPGDATIIATHGSFKAVWSGLLIRNRAGRIEIDPASVSVRSYRLERGVWMEVSR